MLNKNKTSKYILYALGEIILVVIGILIALQLNTWKEEKKTADLETTYLKRLLSDNKQDLKSFTEYISGFDQGLKSIEALSTALNNTTKDSVLIQTVMDYYDYATGFPLFSTSKSTFEDLSSTGNLSVIKNSQLRDKIVKHYGEHEYNRERIRLSTEWVLPLDDTFTLKNHLMRFDSSVAFLYPNATYKAIAKEVRQNKLDYIDNSAAHYWVNTDAMERFKELKGLTSILITALEKELKLK